jgi:undecaprenyl-diphosphatase
VMYWLEKSSVQNRKESSATWRDTLFVGFMQCLALFPGVSRSGATIVGSMMLGFNRLTAMRLSFFLSIPALLAAGVLQGITHSGSIATDVGWTPTIIATIVSFVVAYGVVAWLLRYIATHSFMGFIRYRVALALVLIVLLTTGVIS